MGGTVSIMERDNQNNRLSGKGDYMTGFCYMNSEANNLNCCIQLIHSQKVGSIYKVEIFGFEC